MVGQCAGHEDGGAEEHVLAGGSKDELRGMVMTEKYMYLKKPAMGGVMAGLNTSLCYAECDIISSAFLSVFSLP